MGRFMIPCCCICGKSPKDWEDRTWSMQDFCPKHSNELHFMEAKPWYVRIWRRFFPLKGIEVPADGKIREFTFK